MALADEIWGTVERPPAFFTISGRAPGLRSTSISVKAAPFFASRSLAAEQ